MLACPGAGGAERFEVNCDSDLPSSGALYRAQRSPTLGLGGLSERTRAGALQGIPDACSGPAGPGTSAAP